MRRDEFEIGQSVRKRRKQERKGVSKKWKNDEELCPRARPQQSWRHVRQCGEEFASVRVQLERRDNNAGIEEAHVIRPNFSILLPTITITKYPAAEA